MKLGPVDLTTLMKALQARDDFRGEYFRLSEVIGQIKKATAKKAKKQKKGK